MLTNRVQGMKEIDSSYIRAITVQAMCIGIAYNCFCFTIQQQPQERIPLETKATADRVRW